MENKFGKLLNGSDLKLHRKWFEEMTKLIGIQVIYRSPREGKKYTGYGEFDNYFYEPIAVGCIFTENPTQRTMKKLGWVTELDENASIIEVPYDLPNIQVGALFIIPSGIDSGVGRVFRVSKISNDSIYPASLTCELVPEYKNTCEKSEVQDFKDSNFNLLNSDDSPNLVMEDELNGRD